MKVISLKFTFHWTLSSQERGMDCNTSTEISNFYVVAVKFWRMYMFFFDIHGASQQLWIRRQPASLYYHRGKKLRFRVNPKFEISFFIHFFPEGKSFCGYSSILRKTIFLMLLLRWKLFKVRNQYNISKKYRWFSSSIDLSLPPFRTWNRTFP